MKSKSGYGMKKFKGTKIAGSPSFLIRASDDDDPSMSDAEWESERIGTRDFLRNTTEGRQKLERIKKLRQRLKGV